MAQVLSKIVINEETGEEYPFQVSSDNVSMPNGMSLTDFYNYFMDFVNNGHFMIASAAEPQSNNVKFWYKQD